MDFIEQIAKEQEIKDFPKDSILSFIASFPKNTDPMVMALQVANRFNGEKVHIHAFDRVTKVARDELRKRSCQ